MTKTFGTDSKNDLYLGDGKNLTFLDGLPAVSAGCETATKAQLGEMVLATQSGIPNFQTVWTGSPNYNLYASYLRRTLLSVLGVLDVTDLQITTLNNLLSYTAKIRTQFGSVGLNGR